MKRLAGESLVFLMCVFSLLFFTFFIPGSTSAAEKAIPGSLDEKVAQPNAAFDADKMGDMSDYNPSTIVSPTGDTIKIAVVASFSGPAAANGEFYWNIAQWVAHDYNKRGGIWVDGKKKLIQVIKADHQSKPDVCRKVCERMALQEKVHVFMGTDGSHMMKIINEAANWYYMNGGKASVPVVIWGIINRLGEQAAQHSQALHSLFAHVPGLKVVMPATPYDAKGLMISAIRDPNPVIYIDHRLLCRQEGEVPKELYAVEIGKGIVRRKGRDVTIVGISCMAIEAQRAAEQLEGSGIDAEVIDLRSAKPIDEGLILRSVKKTGRLVIADGGWKTCGWAAEIAALASESAWKFLKAPIRRITLPDCPAPASAVLEKVYYRSSADIVKAVRQVLK